MLTYVRRFAGPVLPGWSGIASTSIRTAVAEPRSPPTISAPDGSRNSEIETAAKVCRSGATRAVAFTFVVPRNAPVVGLNRKRTHVTE